MKRILLLSFILFLTIDFYGQCFPLVSTETYYLEEGDSLNVQDTTIFDNGIYQFPFLDVEGCDSIIQIACLPADLENEFYYLPDSLALNSTGCDSTIYHCLDFRKTINAEFEFYLNDIFLGGNDYTVRCSDDIIFNSCGQSQSYIFPLQVAIYTPIADPDIHFYVNSLEELVPYINYYLPQEDFGIEDDFGMFWWNFNSGSIGIQNAFGGELCFFIVDPYLEGIPKSSIPLTLASGENNFEVRNINTGQSKTIIIQHNHQLPEIQEQVFEYLMELGQQVTFPIFVDDLCEEIISRESICEDQEKVEFELLENDVLKFKALELGEAEICYKFCDATARCDTFKLKIEIVEPIEEEEEEEEIEPEPIFTRNIFPNPAKHSLTITEENGRIIEQVKLYDSTGKCVETFYFGENNLAELIFLKNYQGFYLLEIQIDIETYFKKVILVP